MIQHRYSSKPGQTEPVRLWQCIALEAWTGTGRGLCSCLLQRLTFPNKPLQLAFTLWASKSDLDFEMPSWPTPSSWVHTVHSWQNACYGNELTCPQWSFVQQMAFDIFRCILARRERVNLWSATHLACQAGDVSQMQIDFLQSQKSRCRTNIHTHTTA